MTPYPIGTKVVYDPQWEPHKEEGKYFRTHEGTITAKGQFEQGQPNYTIIWKNIPKNETFFKNATYYEELKNGIKVAIRQDWIKTKNEILLGAI